MDVNDDYPIEVGGKIYKIPNSQRQSYKKFCDLKKDYKRLGVEFKFTYEDWLAWWAQYPDVRRGNTRDGFSMVRINPNGPFCRENVHLVSNFVRRSNAGRRDPRATAVLTPSGIFQSASQAARAYGVDTRMVFQWIKKEFPGWSYVENNPKVGENS